MGRVRLNSRFRNLISAITALTITLILISLLTSAMETLTFTKLSGSKSEREASGEQQGESEPGEGGCEGERGSGIGSGGLGSGEPRSEEGASGGEQDVLKDQQKGSEKTLGRVARHGNTICVRGYVDLSLSPVFEIYGLVNSTYIRVQIGEIYENGTWILSEKSQPLRYEVQTFHYPYNVKSTVGSFQIIPIMSLEGFLPSASYPIRLEIPNNRNILYYADQRIFLSHDIINESYQIIYVNYLFDSQTLASYNYYLSSYPEYLSVPSYMLPDLKSLAEKIVERYRARTAYEKLEALRDFLRTNYKYDLRFTPSPDGTDPILWFLFHEKRGVCIHFNSAFVLLARSLGIPARLVSGYLVEPDKEYQVVYRYQAHAYAEVLFEDVKTSTLGWIIFDATAPGIIDVGRPIRTYTEITRMDPIGVKGSSFQVQGKVIDEHGSKVSGLSVRIYLKRNKTKDELGILVGEGFVENGFFNISCKVPLNIDVGSYFVVAHAVSNEKYMGSWSDPQVKIMAQTLLSANIPEKIIAGRTYVISGELREFGTKAPLANQTVTLTIGSTILSAVTNAEGIFALHFSIETPGNYTLIFRFNGSEYYLGSTYEKNVGVLPLTISPTTKPTFIRGETAHISGRVHADDLSGDGEDVLIALNGATIAKVKTDVNGYFSSVFLVPQNHTLGKFNLEYFLLSNNNSIIQEINVIARTSILVSISEMGSETGKLFSITATLLDNLQQPIPNASIFLNYSHKGRDYTMNSFTNENGEVTFNISLSLNGGETIFFLVHFPGNEIYLSSQFLGNISIVPPALGTSVKETYQFPILLLLTIGLLGSFIVFVSRRGGFRAKPPVEVPENQTHQREATSPPSVGSRRPVSLTIVFPDIEKGFPLVWGINDRLLVRLEVKDVNGQPVGGALLKLSINGRETTDLRSSQDGTAETYLTFPEKGVHKLEAHFAGDDRWGEAKAEASIKIVDYREEIVNLFNIFLEKALKLYEGLDKNMTVREIQSILARQLPTSTQKDLEVMASIFEVASYSFHKITRKEYELMFLSLNSIERGGKNV